MPSDPSGKTRVRIAFLLLFVFIIVLSVGAYFVSGLSKLQDGSAARDSRTALQGITSPGQIDEALAQHPSNKFLRLTATAIRTANETSAAAEKLSNEVEPPAISKIGNLGAASRGDLEALRRDLKTAEANATTFLPRYIALLKTERHNVEKHALSLHAGNETTSRILDNIDKRHSEFLALVSRMLPARAELYRAYGDYVAFLIAESGTYKVVDGQFLFPLQRTVDRYNVAARAMTVATKRVVELEEERRGLLTSQQQGWVPFVSGK
ncbi:MAG: hypothetical protein JWR80_6892 [Bradyrhizobium sp.]|nr:hypothetical protein [Bradyrhizobium sp.]